MNLYFPIWILLLVPPIVFALLFDNIVLTIIGFVISFIVIERVKPKKADVIKSIFLTILLDLLNTALFCLPELFVKNSFIKNNLIVPLETNPYTNVLSIIYVALILFIDFFIAKLFIDNIVLKKYKNLKYKNKISIIIVLLMIPYLYFVPTSKIVKTSYKSLEDYKGLSVKNTGKIKTILKYIDSKKYITSYIIDTSKEPYTVELYLHDIDTNHQVIFEKDAATILYLASDANEVKYHYNDKIYIYTINDINKIYKDIKKLKLQDIYVRYDDNNFLNYNYLGRVGKYDIFDTSDTCSVEAQVLFNYNNTDYLLACSSIENVYAYVEGMPISISNALNYNVITKEEILNSTIDLVH